MRDLNKEVLYLHDGKIENMDGSISISPTRVSGNGERRSFLFMYAGTEWIGHQRVEFGRVYVMKRNLNKKLVCGRGHPRTPENTYRRNDGYSYCRLCKLAQIKKPSEKRMSIR
jgi:hypothetical protein